MDVGSSTAAAASERPVRGADLTLQIAGIGVRTVTPESDIVLQVRPPESWFLTPRADVRFDLEVVAGPTPDPEEGELLFRVEDVWSVSRSDGKLRVDQALGHGDYHLSRSLLLDFETGTGTMTVAPQDNYWCFRTEPEGRVTEPFQYPILPLLIYWELANRQGLGIHASGAVIDGGACIFAGVSGAGKSTISDLLHGAGYTILNDDRLGLLPTGKGFEVHGTPWHGSSAFAIPQSAPLRAVFFLKQAPANKAERMLPLQAVAELVARACPPYFSHELMSQVAATCAQIAAGVPCYRLSFLPDESVLECIRQAIPQT
jgi:hypothetical protein